MAYVPPTYEPSTLVENLNAVPRWDSASSDFSTDTDYVIGAATVGAVFVFFGVITIFVIPFWKCCCAKKCCTPKLPPGSCGKLFYFLTIVAVFTAMGIGFWGDGESTKSVESVSSIISDASDLIGDGADVMNAIQNDTDYMIASIGDFRTTTDFSGGHCSASSTAADSVEDYLQASLGYVDDYVDVIDGYTDSLDDYIDTVDEFQEVKTLASTILLSFVAAMALVFLSSLILAPRKKGALSCLCNAAVVPLGTGVLTVCWTVVGVLLVFSVINADLCMKPDENLLEYSPDSFVYYIEGCQGEPEVLQTVWNTRDSIANATTDLNSWETAATTEGCTEAAATIDYLRGALSDSTDNVNDAADLVSCESLNGLYTDAMYEMLCTDIIYGVTMVWASLLLIAVTTLISVCLHPRCASPHAYHTSAESANEDYALSQYPTQAKSLHNVYAI